MPFCLFRLEAYHEELHVHEELLLFTLAVDEDEFAEIDREMRWREDVEPPYVRFDLNKTRTLNVEWLTIPFFFFARRKQVQQSAWSKKKRLMWTKSQKIKSPRKSNPPQYLWGCFEGVFVPDLTRLGMREGVFVPDLTRSDVRVRGLGLIWASGPTRSDRDQHQTRSRTRHRNLTRLVSHILLTSLLPPSPFILWIELGDKPKWLPLNFGYHDEMRTGPISILEFRKLALSTGQHSLWIFTLWVPQNMIHSRFSAVTNWWRLLPSVKLPTPANPPVRRNPRQRIWWRHQQQTTIQCKQ